MITPSALKKSHSKLSIFLARITTVYFNSVVLAFLTTILSF